MNNDTHLDYTLPTQSSMQHGSLTSAFNYIANPHTHSKGFFHPWPLPPRQGAQLLSWLINRQPAAWPRWQSNPVVQQLPIARPDAPLNDWKIWFIGHVIF